MAATSISSTLTTCHASVSSRDQVSMPRGSRSARPSQLASSRGMFAGHVCELDIATRGMSLAPAGPRVSHIRAASRSLAPPEERERLYEGIQKLGPDMWNRSYYPKLADHLNVEKQWYIVDASEKRLGRLATAIANHIRGKNLPTYTPSVDMGAYVIVINAEKIEVTGQKRFQKKYYRHSGRPGGLTVETFDQLQKRIPERIVEHAVKGMLPKGRLGRELFTHLKVYKGESHPHAAQKPAPLPIADKRINI